MEKGASFVTADPAKCTGCRSCELACFAAHEKQAATSKTVGCVTGPVIPNLFVTWMTAGSATADSAAASAVPEPPLRMPIQCHHCEDAPCLRSCVEGAITRNAEGAVLVNAKRCIGCRNCALACPFGAIAIIGAALKESTALSGTNTVAAPIERGSVAKCDLCEGRTEGPACIAACPNEALRKVDIGDELLRKREAAAAGFEALSSQVRS